jgi:hypothetical protein
MSKLEACARKFLADPIYAETVVIHAREGSVGDIEICQRAMELPGV